MFPLKTEIAVSKRTATVVVLIPPAVPAGEPPMIISMLASSFEPFVRPDWDILANPAVLVVTDWKKAAWNFPAAFNVPIVAGL